MSIVMILHTSSCCGKKFYYLTNVLHVNSFWSKVTVCVFGSRRILYTPLMKNFCHHEGYGHDNATNYEFDWSNGEKKKRAARASRTFRQVRAVHCKQREIITFEIFRRKLEQTIDNKFLILSLLQRHSLQASCSLLYQHYCRIHTRWDYRKIVLIAQMFLFK